MFDKRVCYEITGVGALVQVQGCEGEMTCMKERKLSSIRTSKGLTCAEHCGAKGEECSLKMTSQDMKIQPLVSRHL